MPRPGWGAAAEKDKSVRSSVLHPEPVAGRNEQGITRHNVCRLLSAAVRQQTMKAALAAHDVPDFLNGPMRNAGGALTRFDERFREAQTGRALRAVQQDADFGPVRRDGIRRL